MGDTRQVKVDNWGTFFLQRLKHFFNRTDYCDLTLQFQDNAQLKVHRLVLNACTEYFELLERTCEMYEDCLIMPDDLQADVVVPIVNFMYTGQLEYKFDLLDRLYQTAQIMNMSVLTKLLDAHRVQPTQPKPAVTKYRQLNYARTKKAVPSTSQQKVYIPPSRNTHTMTHTVKVNYDKKPRRRIDAIARPTRYELPEELDKDDIFENSFMDISYDSKPLMTHPLKDKKRVFTHVAQYETQSSKKFEELRKIMKRPSTSTADVAEFKRLKMNQNTTIFGESDDYAQGSDMLDDPFDIRSGQSTQVQMSADPLFDHIVDTQGAKVTIETKSNNENPIDHAKIISEVLKKYPHLVKNNKNIKLKIVNTPSKSENKSIKKGPAQMKSQASPALKPKSEKEKDFTYETDITDTKEMGKLIALGVENVKGPWLCLICGTPGKALNFCSYHKFRNHLVEVHNERPPSNMCEFCGLKSGKRNHLLHHIYTKHGVPPPPSYHFPKCNQCSYIALTQAFLIKHKMAHGDVRSFNCNVCQASFKGSNQLLQHIQQTGHKICPDRKANLQCIYCMKVFLRESNLYAHLKTAHKSSARNDGIIDDSDEDQQNDHIVKAEPIIREEVGHNMDNEEDEVESEDIDEGQYQIHQEFDGKFQIINKKTKSPNQKILNKSLPPVQSFSQQTKKPEAQTISKVHSNIKHLQDIEPSILTDNYNERIVVLNQNEFLLKGNGSSEDVNRNAQNDEYIISDMLAPQDNSQTLNITLPQAELSPTMSNIPLEDAHRIHEKVPNNQLVKKAGTVEQPYQIVVSSEQEYKALMAANPSIIFQDETQSKTLSVLAHDSEMTAENIDLDPSQNSNMMIIQDDYPINVSETLTGDNSNIVVVYSHPLDTQGKQYVQYSDDQLVSAQNIPEQLVSTSHVIPSIGNATSLIDGRMIVQESVEQWQNEEQHAVETALVDSEPIVSHITMQDEPETTHSAEQAVNSPTVIDKGLAEIGELQIISQTTDVITEVVLSQPSEIQQELQETVIDQSEATFNPEAEHEQIVCVNPEVPEPVHADNQDPEVVLPQDQSLSEMEIENQEETVPLDSQDMTTSSIEEQPEIGIPQNDEEMEATIESESSQELSENEPQSIVQATSSVGPVNKQIESLAAEWSDEDSSSKLPEESTQAERALQIDEISGIENTPEVEESIENIQQEMENQLTNTPSTKRIIITSDITLPSSKSLVKSSPNTDLSSPQIIDSKPKGSPPTDISKSKISSLLNDWDDNDSQPESNGAKTPEKSIEEPVGKPEQKENESSDVKEVPVKGDKIKSVDKIMSDWDDEEEKEE